MTTPYRVQFAESGRLIAEVLVSSYREAARTMDAFQLARYVAGKPLCGATFSRADLKRLWDVPVGSEVQS